jgi:hypothetical protein
VGLLLFVSVCVCRIVEIRSCTTGPANVVDFSDNHDSVVVTGNAIFEGNMAFKGEHRGASSGACLRVA